MVAKLEIKLLGEFRFTYSGELVDALNTNRLQSLLTYLLIHRKSPQPRQQVAVQLWPETSDRQARTNLRNLLFQLKKAFPAHNAFLHIDAKSLQWRNDAAYTLDSAEFEALLDAEGKFTVTAYSSTDDGSLLSHYQAAIDLYRGDLVPSLYDDWVLHERNRYHQLYLSALRECSRGLEERREYGLAIQLANRLVVADPLQESTYRQLMCLHAHNRDRGAIFQTYQQCVQQLEQEVGVEPSPETVTLRDTLMQSVVIDNTVGQSLQNADPYRPITRRTDGAVGHIPVRAKDEPEQLRSLDDLSAQKLAQPTRPDELGTSDLSPVYRRLVGRHSEWATLREAWQQTQNGQSHCVVIRGEAGIGKSRLAEELVTWVRQRGASVAVSHCYTAQQNIPYRPVIRWLRSPVFSSALATIDEKWLTEVSRLLPELGSTIPDFEKAGPITEGWQRRHLFDSLIRIVNAVAEPLLLLIDDVHWSDAESLEWLSSLLHEHQTVSSTAQNQTALLLVATLRDEEISDTPALQSWNEDLQRQGLLTNILLGPLNQADTLLLGSDVSVSSLSNEDGTKLFEQTEGHPLYIVESVRSGMNFGAAVVEKRPNSLPRKAEAAVAESATIQSIIKTRIRLLSESTQALLNLASVIGREFNYQLLVDASDIAERDLINGLDEAIERGIIREREEETYDFSHALLRDALYDELSNARRRFYHKTLAKILEDSAHENTDAMAPQLARHFEKSGDATKAIDYYLRSATAARDVYANEEALSYYQHLLSSKLSHKLTIEERCDILANVGKIWARSGQLQNAMPPFNQLLELANEAELHQFQAIAYLGISRLEKRESKYADAMKRLQLAREFFTSCSDLWGLADTLHAMGICYIDLGQTELAQPICEEELKIGEQLESVLIQCRAKWGLGRVAEHVGDYKKSLEIYKMALEFADQHDLVEMRAQLADAAAYISMTVGDFDGLWKRLIKGFDDAQSVGSTGLILRNVYTQIMVSTELGDFSATRKCTLYALASCIKCRELPMANLVLGVYALSSLRHGKYDLVEGLLKFALSFADYCPNPQSKLTDLSTLGNLYLETEQFDELYTFIEQHPSLLHELESVPWEKGNYAVTYHVATARQQLLDGTAPDEALSTLRQMLVEAQRQTEPHREQLANLHYWLWDLDPSLDADREEATQLYANLYENQPVYQFRQRYQKLTGISLPAPPPLELPAIVTEVEYDLDDLLAQVNEWLAELQSTQSQNSERANFNEIQLDESAWHKSVSATSDYKQEQPVDETRAEKSATPSGQSATLAELPSQLHVGAVGTLAGRPFEVKGYARYRSKNAHWDDWFVLLDDEQPRWLTESEGSYQLLYSESLTSAIPAFDEIAVNTTILFNGRTIFVTEKGTATLLRSEGGPSPYMAMPGEEFGFIDGVADDVPVTIEFMNSEIVLFVGHALQPSDIQVDDREP